MAEMQFDKMKADINTFVDDVYAPFIINFALKDEMKRYKQKKSSIYGSIEAAGKSESDQDIKIVVEEMFDLQKYANKKIEAMRSDLLGPILAQEAEVLENIKRSYDNVTYGNAAVTNYLVSVQKMKQTQGRALERVGLKNVADNFNTYLTKTSTIVSDVVQQGLRIDMNDASAEKDINALSELIKNASNNN